MYRFLFLTAFLQHEQPTDNFLTKKQYTLIQGLVESLDDLAELIGSRLVETLRRKNEALKQAAKRERSDPLAALVPSMSPTCLNDDFVSLRLLVKLGKTQEAATAYSARRSLLLLERCSFAMMYPWFVRRRSITNSVFSRFLTAPKSA